METPTYVWVVRMHDRHENASMTVSVWTDEKNAVAASEDGQYQIDRVHLDTPWGTNEA